jgi:hypothetical protein
MDAFYSYRHSRHADEELRYSLRSVTKHLPWIRKVWIFGDRPRWLADRTDRIEHVSHDRVAWIAGVKTPVVNTFLMMYLAALLPQVHQEFLWFADDYILLDDVDETLARRQRTIQDLSQVENRGRGVFKDALWRTYDVLRRFDLPGLNYESHVPVHLRKHWILDAVQQFRDFITEDRYFGLLAKTTILNHAQVRHGFSPVVRKEEGLYAGFHNKAPSYEEIVQGCAGKAFLNFDDDGYSLGMRRFLEERFPAPCVFEGDSTESFSLARDVAPSAICPESDLPIAGNQIREASVPPAPPSSLDPGRCVVLVPHRGRIAPQCQSALDELERRGYVVRRQLDESGGDRIRNRMAADALADGFEETIWIGPQIGFAADAVDRLRSHHLPLTAAIYAKVGQRAMAVHPLDGLEKIVLGKKGGLYEFLYVGAGFLHVRREVYESMQIHLALPLCDAHLGRPHVPFFQPLVREWQNGHWYLDEDFAFCQRARSCGYAMMADTTIRLWHVGEAAHSWEEAGIDRERFATFHYAIANPP